MEGRFDNIISTIFELLKNGFIQALNHSLDYEMNINSVGAEEMTSGEQAKAKRAAKKEDRKIGREQKKEEKAKEDE